MEFERAVWPLAVVVADIGADDALELAAVEDEQPVEALATDAADPALHVRVRVRRPNWGSDDPDALITEERVEPVGELRIPIMDREPGLLTAVVEIHAEVPSLLKHPRSVGVAGARDVLDPAAPKHR